MYTTRSEVAHGFVTIVGVEFVETLGVDSEPSDFSLLSTVEKMILSNSG